MAERKPTPAADRRATPAKREHVYCEDGRIVGKVVVLPQPDGTKKVWQESLWYEDSGWHHWVPGGFGHVLYNLSEVLEAAKAGDHIHITEGEKDADTLIELGLVATTNPCGAKAWPDVLSKQLVGAGGITLYLDRDADGWDRGRRIVASFEKVSPDTPLDSKQSKLDEPKADVTDHLDAGFKLDQLESVDIEGDEAPTASGEYEFVTKEEAEGIRESFFGDDEDDDDEEEPQQTGLHLPGPKPWPVLDEAAFHGPLGQLAKRLLPETESDPAALLIDTVVSFGNAVGPGPCFFVERTRHTPKIWMLQVGETARSKKGTTHNNTSYIFRQIDADWYSREAEGVASGEGIITKMATEGVDKRLLLVESEFSHILSVARREGSVVSQILRKAWDKDTLEIMRSKNPLYVSGTHISIIGHITIDDLRENLTKTEIANGFANRFLFCCCRRSKLLATGGNLSDEVIAELGDSLVAALRAAEDVGEMWWTPEGELLWKELYEGPLDIQYGGLVGALTARGPAQCLRLSLIYALADGSAQVDVEHVKAAYAVWKYCEDSAAYIYPTSTGNPIADRILEKLYEQQAEKRARGEDRPASLTRKQVNRLFHSNKTSEELDQAIAVLVGLGVAEEFEGESTGGRPPKGIRLLST